MAGLAARHAAAVPLAAPVAQPARTPVPTPVPAAPPPPPDQIVIQPDDLPGTFVVAAIGRQKDLFGEQYEQFLRRVGPPSVFVEPRSTQGVYTLALRLDDPGIAEFVYQDIAHSLFGTFLSSQPISEDAATEKPSGGIEGSLPFDRLDRIKVGSRAVGARFWSELASDTSARIALFQHGSVIGLVALFSYEPPAEADEVTALSLRMDSRAAPRGGIR